VPNWYVKCVDADLGMGSPWAECIVGAPYKQEIIFFLLIKQHLVSCSVLEKINYTY